MRGLLLVFVLARFGLAFAQPGDWGPKRDPFDRVVIARYQQLLAKDPHDVALAKLCDMYKRYRTLAQLVAEYETKLAAAPDDRTLLVIAARLREVAGDKPGAIELYTRALAAEPGDAATALRVAGVLRSLARLPDARTVLETALDKAPRHRELVKALAELAELMRDRVGAATYYTRLVELDPTNARAHIDRGDALLAIGFFERAAEAYAAAEKLLVADPARRLDVIAARGRALERVDAAGSEAEYRRAIAFAPRGHYLREELFGRVVELHRRTGTVHELLVRTLAEWPEGARGIFEWTQLAAMFDAVGHRDDATACLEKAVAKSADARLHLQLADRYGGIQNKRAFEILDTLANRMQRDLGVLLSIAERYARWGHMAKALAAYEKILRLDPSAEERLIGLVETPLRANDEAAARIALRSVTLRLTKASSFGRLGEVLLEWGLYRESDQAFTLALKRDEHDRTLWRGRAAARDSLGEIPGAVADAERVIALSSDANDRRQARKELVRIVMHTSSHSRARLPYVEAWREAFSADPPDIDAGFLLLEFYSRAPCEAWHSARYSCEREIIGILDQLSKITPLDFDDVISLATSHAAARRHHEAYEILALLERVMPDRKADIEKHRAKIGEWRLRPHRRHYRYHHRGQIFSSYSYWIGEDLALRRRRDRLRLREREAIPTPIRAGLRIGAGTGMRGEADHVITVGTLATARVARNVYVTSRLDYTERQQLAVPIRGAAMSLGVGTALRTGRTTALVLGLSQRIERRFGDMIEEANLSRVGISTDLSLDLIGRKAPLGIGTRIEQSLRDGARSTAALLELTLELR